MNKLKFTRSVLTAFSLVIFLEGGYVTEARLIMSRSNLHQVSPAMENPVLGRNTAESPDSAVGWKNPFFSFDRFTQPKPDSNNKYKYNIIGPRAPIFRFPRPSPGITAVILSDNISNSLDETSVEPTKMNTRSFKQNPFTGVGLKKRRRRPLDMNHKVSINKFIKRQQQPDERNKIARVRRGVPEVGFAPFDTMHSASFGFPPFEPNRLFPDLGLTTLENQHRRVKKGSVTYPGPSQSYGSTQQQWGYGFAFGQPQQTQYSAQPSFNPAPSNVQAMSPANNPGSMTMLQQLSRMPFSPQLPFGTTIFSIFSHNPDDIIKTGDQPFHFHIPLVSSVPQPFPSMEDMVKVALQYKNPLDTEALLPEEKRRPNVPLFLQPYVLPGKRFSRNLEKNAEAAHSETQKYKQSQAEKFEHSDANINEVADNLDKTIQDQDQETLLMMSKLEDELMNSLKQTLEPVQGIEEELGAKLSDDIMEGLEKKDTQILKRHKRGFFSWFKNLFKKSEPEPKPVKEPSRPKAVRPVESRPAIQTTTQRSRPPPEAPKPTTFHREQPVHISASTNSSKDDNSTANLGLKMPSDPKLPTNPDLHSGTTGVDTKVDKLLPESMRTSAILDRTEAPKTRTKRSPNNPADFNTENGPNSLSLSKQEMKLLHELFLNIVVGKCQVDRQQLIHVALSVQNIIQMSDLPETPFAINRNPIAARLVEQLVICRSYNPRSLAEPVGYNYGSYMNPNQYQPAFGNNQIVGEVDEGEPVLRMKRGKRSAQNYGLYPQIRIPIHLAYLLHVEFLITQVVKEHCGPGLDLALLKTVGDMILQTVENECLQRQCYSTRPQTTLNLDNDLFFCARKPLPQQSSYGYPNSNGVPFVPNHSYSYS